MPIFLTDSIFFLLLKLALSSQLVSFEINNYLEEVSISECGWEAEDEISFRVFRDGLHDGPVHDDEVLRGGLHRPALLRVARVEQQGGALQANPVAFPSPLASKFNLKRF